MGWHRASRERRAVVVRRPRRVRVVDVATEIEHLVLDDRMTRRPGGGLEHVALCG